VIKKLGWGHFSTVWMVKDRSLVVNKKSGNGMLFYAVKVQKSANHYTEAAMDEVELLDCISKESKRCEGNWKKSPTGKDSSGVSYAEVVDHSHHVATLHDSFFHTGPHGRHMCMVFSMLGCNLLTIIKAYNYRGVPIQAVKKMMKGITKGLDFLHRKCDIIHTDLKPENVLLQFPGQMGSDNTTSETDDASVEEGGEKQVSIAELEAALQDPKTPTDERKKIRKRLKKRRQRERRRQGNSDTEPSTVDNNLAQLMTSFSDEAMERMINNKGAQKPTKDAHERVLSRLSHSQFVMRNFTPVITIGGDVTAVIDDMVKVSRPSKSELSAHFQLCSAQATSRQRPVNSGVAEVTFLLRAFVPEGEIADNITKALGGIPWEMSEEKSSSREW
jgi:serine/threonine-protein kinase SRPK3